MPKSRVRRRMLNNCCNALPQRRRNSEISANTPSSVATLPLGVTPSRRCCIVAIADGQVGVDFRRSPWPRAARYRFRRTCSGGHRTSGRCSPGQRTAARPAAHNAGAGRGPVHPNSASGATPTISTGSRRSPMCSIWPTRSVARAHARCPRLVTATRWRPPGRSRAAMSRPTLVDSPSRAGSRDRRSDECLHPFGLFGIRRWFPGSSAGDTPR